MKRLITAISICLSLGGCFDGGPEVALGTCRTRMASLPRAPDGVGRVLYLYNCMDSQGYTQLAKGNFCHSEGGADESACYKKPGLVTRIGSWLKTFTLW